MAEIRDSRGNIFLSDCEVTAITVNCRGVMGAGIALEAKLRWPSMFDEYASLCSRGLLRPGQVTWWPSQGTPKVLCFPTKDDWKRPSTLQFIRSGLDAFATEYLERGVESIAMPHLGCSHGGLRWSEVRPLIVERLSGVPDLEVELWEFDPYAPDPWFETLTDLFEHNEPAVIARRLELKPNAVANLASALRSPGVRGLATLQTARGIGEKTLEKVYAFLFNPNGDADCVQQTLL